MSFSPSRHARACGCPFPLHRHARPRSGIQSKESVFRDSGQPIPCHPLSLARGAGAKNPYFAGRQGKEKRHSCCLDPRLRKDDRRRGVVGGGFFYGQGHVVGGPADAGRIFMQVYACTRRANVLQSPHNLFLF